MNEKQEEVITVKHRYTVYPKGFLPVSGNAESTFMVARYTDQYGANIAVTGYNLPTGIDVEYEIHGEWKCSDKYGKSFQMSYFVPIYPSTEKGFISYMKSLKVGIGPAKAKTIYKRFGAQIWDILDATPEKIAEVKGISQKTVAKLQRKLEETNVQRELIKLFGKTTISAAKIAALVKEYGENTINVIKTRPYDICKVEGFGFRTVDRLALGMGFKPNDPERLVRAAVFVLDCAAQEGHTCLPIEEFTKAFYKESNKGFTCEVVTHNEIDSAFEEAKKRKFVYSSTGHCYTEKRYKEEVHLACNVCSLINAGFGYQSDIDSIIDSFERLNSIKLAPLQREAVKRTFRSQLIVITGGPGTGKTTIIKAILYVHKTIYGDYANPLLMSPTGRAARRMSEATGYEARTVHSILFSNALDDLETSQEEEEIEGNLFIVDECSMMDLSIADSLFRKIPVGSRVVLVGDPDQLPSVGYGNVLYELLRSRIVPSVKLNVVFRQGKDSPIIANAAKIRDGKQDLIYTQKGDVNGQFRLYRYSTPSVVFDRACRLYLESVKRFGIDNVILLCPFRAMRKAELSVEKFNLELQKILNPQPEQALKMVKDGNTKFYAGDRVMQMKNTKVACNGEVGVIKEMKYVEDDDSGDDVLTAFIEFNGDGRIHEYREDDIADLDLAYCTTVHKSQGSEYDTVIAVLSVQHSVMLRRNIVYTAVTRAKENVFILTEAEGTQIDSFGRLCTENALTEAIKNNQADVRYSLLADRIVDFCNKQAKRVLAQKSA